MLENANPLLSGETPAKAGHRREKRELEELQRKRSVDAALDDALAETFPASDPVAVVVLS